MGCPLSPSCKPSTQSTASPHSHPSPWALQWKMQQGCGEMNAMQEEVVALWHHCLLPQQRQLGTQAVGFERGVWGQCRGPHTVPSSHTSEAMESAAPEVGWDE